MDVRAYNMDMLDSVTFPLIGHWSATGRIIVTDARYKGIDTKFMKALKEIVIPGEQIKAFRRNPAAGVSFHSK